MTTQHAKADAFHALHVIGDPLVLFNIWDAGSAKQVAIAGAKALATGSHSVAGALGYDDGEQAPLNVVIDNIARIVSATTLPISLDFEGAYAVAPQGVAANTKAALQTGVVGFNFEDQIVDGESLYSIAVQAARIAAMRGACDDLGVNAYINARTDIFLKAPHETHNQSMVDHAIERALAYHKAGASGLFVPGLRDAALIAQVTAQSPMPVNVMAVDGGLDKAALAELGVARISHGPRPWNKAMAFLKDNAVAAFNE
jgi:2-methylisocitrate lyase-like PEP mutase family enzyme